MFFSNFQPTQVYRYRHCADNKVGINTVPLSILKLYANKTGQPVTGGATLAVTVSSISKLARCIQKTCDKKNCQKNSVITFINKIARLFKIRPKL